MKFATWLMKTMLSALIGASVSIATTYVVVNAYVQQLMSQFGAEHAVRPPGLGDVLGALAPFGTGGAGASVAGTELPHGRPNADETAPDKNGSGDESGTSGASEFEGAEPDAPSVEAEPAPEDALPVMGRASADEEVLLSADDLNERKERLTDEERMEIYSLLISKIPANDIQTISTLMEGGITSEEMEEASTILRRHLTEEEYEQLVGILMD